MLFPLSVRITEGSDTVIPLKGGDVLFVVGANGTGKSSLLHSWYTAYHGRAHRISAHRQTWFASNSIDLSPAAKRNTEQYIANSDTNPQSRWMDQYSSERSSIAIYELIDAENVRARRIASEVDQDRISEAQEIAKKAAPVATINELLRLSNLPVTVVIESSERVLASKNGSPNYSIAELSDGERNAVIIAASVLTAKSNTLILIDEPERHLHRSIISPLLTSLFAKRPDCTFVVSTHDVLLPIDNPNSFSLLVRSCHYVGPQVQSWSVDLLKPDQSPDEQLKLDILGARRKILFVEGTSSSLDAPIYSLIFPNVSIIPKGSCREVETALHGLRQTSDLHWILAFGIVDNDRRSPDELARLSRIGVYTLPFYSVESLYYHPDIISYLASTTLAVFC